ncbi:hypothetical protein [Leptolyngbya sp. 7M]|uniref:hypothetical protein n=1 Tax=Leptolyngbya sp. 7M TaxID=2812896 RepID=UPI0021F189CF|nr:hypothetical protein [Leptolyngbya sp. 7M]
MQRKTLRGEVIMSFSAYRSLGETVKEFQTKYTEADFITEVKFNISDYFRQDLQLMMEDAVVDNSEFAICENLVYPVLKEVWKLYRKKFILWSHQFLNCDANLSGFPEYILARRSPLGKVVFDQPYFVLSALNLSFHLRSFPFHLRSPPLPRGD